MEEKNTSPKKGVYKNDKVKRPALSKKQQQMIIIAALALRIVVAAVLALSGKGKNPVISSDLMGDASMAFSGSYDPMADTKYDDSYTVKMAEYTDVILPENKVEDKNYFKETVFVGDSNTEGLNVYNHLSIQYVLGMTGMAIQRVNTNPCMYFVGYENPVTIPTAVGMLKPRRIIINFGTNNAGGTTTEDFIAYYRKTLRAIEKSYPYCDIIVESVLPVCKTRNYPNITMQDIDDFNIALAQMCREDGYPFLNSAEIFKDKDGFAKSEYFAKDGIHLSSDGYKALLEYVKTHKFITKDTRPATGYIPTRRPAPVVVQSSDEGSSSVLIASSSKPHSSSWLISSSSLFASSSKSSYLTSSVGSSSQHSIGASSVMSHSYESSSQETQSSEEALPSQRPTEIPTPPQEPVQEQTPEPPVVTPEQPPVEEPTPQPEEPTPEVEGQPPQE